MILRQSRFRACVKSNVHLQKNCQLSRESRVVRLVNVAYGDVNRERRSIPRTVRPPHREGDDRGKLRIFAWNINGLRALLAKRPHRLRELWEREAIDILGLIEVKICGPVEILHAAEETLKDILGSDISIICNPGQRKGYAGTAVILRRSIAERVHSIDLLSPEEGRLITVRFESLCVVVVYSPNSGSIYGDFLFA